MRFENPAHRQALMNLGLLMPDETNLAAAILAERLVTNPAALAEILYIFKQELAQPLSTFGMIEGLLEMLREQARAIQSREDLGETVKEYKHLSALGPYYESYAQDLRQTLNLIYSYDESIYEASDQVAGLLAEIDAYLLKLSKLLQSQSPLVQSKLAYIRQTIVEKESLLGD